MKTAAPSLDLDLAQARLDDYVRGALDDDAAADYEADLFERALAGQAPEAAFRTHLGAALRTMAARGTLELWLTESGVEELRARPDLNVFVFELDVARPHMPEVPPGTDLMITRVPVDLTGVRRIEADIVTPDGRLLKQMLDVTFNRDDGALFACCEMDLARIAGAAKTITRLYAVEEGSRRLMLELPML